VTTNSFNFLRDRNIGARTLVGHQATVTGNCVIGNDVTIGPGVICLERVTVGDGADVKAGADVVRPGAMSGSGLRVLLTNNTLTCRAGSEMYVSDIARALIGRGHHPIAYSTQLGDVAR
jgi:carbonic anhydrase/acetyltransferase-like protein (isoleucine patch superfamily)